jgi:phenylpropionate dioxygenase-like ring-hydroxylating dioxygenase large terminal subunit
MSGTSETIRPPVGAMSVSDADAKALIKRGLRNRWYPILPSRLVGDAPRGIRRLGEKLVVWRDHAGQVHVQADRCPHRGAPLSLGVNSGDRLRCQYHGVEVGPDGTVLAVPGQPGCRLEGMKAVKTFPSREVKGAVFAWFGDALHESPTAYTPPVQLQEGDYDAFLCYAEWKGSWTYGYDNNMDPMHGAFLHAKSHSMAAGATTASFSLRDTEYGFVFEKEGQRDVNFDWSEFCDTGALYVRLEIPYPASGGPGGNFGIIFHGTPIDNDTTAYFFWRFRRVQGWQRDAWRFLYKNRLEARHWHVLEQDRAIMEGLEPDADEREILYNHDAGVVRLRRRMMNEARAQLAALAAAGSAE